MLVAILSIGLVLLVIALIIFFLKKPKKIQKIATQSENSSAESSLYKSDKPQAYRATISLEDHDHSIRPESYQQRNLDREIGGLEEGEKGLKEKKEEEEKVDEDVWDKRSDDVDKMGSFNPLAGDDKESMIW